MDPLEVAAKLGIHFVPFLFALCFHEYAHGWVAHMRGDNTAKMMGRLTMNPLAHADMMGTFMLPILGFLTGLPIIGWANPVPVDERNLKDPRKDMFWIAAAGPLSNVLLATIAAFGYALIFSKFSTWEYAVTVCEFLKLFMAINLFLAFFNLIPVHPLDGGKVLARFISPTLNRKLEDNQPMFTMILFVLMMVGGIRLLSIPVTWTMTKLVIMNESLILW